MQLRVWSAFFLLCIIWGASYLFIRLGLDGFSPLALVAVRLLIGFIVIGVVVLVRREPLTIEKRIVPALIAVATVNTSLPFLLIAWGETSVPSGLASVLNSTVPIFGVLLAAVVLHDEPLTLARSGGVLVGFAGVLLLLSRDLGSGSLLSSHLYGQCAIILASLCYAVGAVLVRRTLRGIPPLTVATYALAISAVETMVLSLILSPPSLGDFSGQTILAVLWLGVFGSGLAYILAYFILAHWGAGQYTLLTYILPVIGLTLGVIVLHEALTWRVFAGSLLVVAGVVLAGMMRAHQTPASRPAG